MLTNLEFEFPSLNILKQHILKCFIFKTCIYFATEIIICKLLHNLFFVFQMLYLFLFSYCWFRYAFQSILLIIDFILHQLHSSKTSFSQNINYFKIIYRILSLLLLLMIMNVRGAFFYFWSSIEMFISIFNNNWFSALKFSFVFDFSCCIIKCSKFADSYIWVCVHFLLITTIVMQRMISQW